MSWLLALLGGALGMVFGPLTSQRTVEYHGLTHQTGGEDEIPVWPIGSVIWWYGALVNGQPPWAGWKLADGTVTVNGVTPPDLRNQVLIGAGTTYALGATGGAVSSSQTHDTLGAHQHDTIPDHTHTHASGNVNVAAGALVAAISGFVLTNNGTHQHNSQGGHAHAAHSVPTLPPYVAGYWIIRVF